MSKLPTESRPLRLHPDLAKALEAELAPLSGEQLDLARMAIVETRDSGVSGRFPDLLEQYRQAIKEAVAA